MPIAPKASLAKLTPYRNGSHNEELLAHHKTTLKLDSNEATVAPSARVTAVLARCIEDGPLNWYPDVEASALGRAVADYTGLPTDHVLTFNGSDHALETIARAYLDAGDAVSVLAPTYDHFRVYAESCDATLTSIPETAPGTLAAKIAASITPRTKIAYVVNPNNPTGKLYTVAEIRAALARLPEVLFIVDEAYFEFCDVTVASLATQFKNLIVTRSFSKAFGLASLRCGYLLAHPERCAEIAKIRVGKNVNALAQAAATAALEDTDHMKRYVEDVGAAKRWLIERLRALSLEVRDTPANFILVRVANPQAVTKYLVERRVYVRDRSDIAGLDGMLRITIGDLLTMKRFWRTFETTPAEALIQTPRAFAGSRKTESARSAV